jgi:hypothetical protein
VIGSTSMANVLEKYKNKINDNLEESKKKILKEDNKSVDNLINYTDNKLEIIGVAKVDRV